jgi:biopolymer transport protein ExbB
VRKLGITCRIAGLFGLAVLLATSSAYAQGRRQQQQQQQAAATQQPEQQEEQAPAGPRLNLAELPQLVQRLRDEERRITQERLQRFRAELQRQEQATQQAIQRRNAAEARSNQLDMAWNNNEARIAELSELLRQHEGNLGELFGVTRQVAGDAATVLSQSLITTQYEAPEGQEERAEFMRRIAGARELPSIGELERLWYELVREMTESAKVVKYTAPVLQMDGSQEEKEVVRIGPFTVVTDNGQYLGYLPSQKSLSVLNGQLEGRFRSIGANLLRTPANATGYQTAVVDPARGALLGLYVERPNFIQRIQEGEVVGYVIVAVGIIGVLLAIFQAAYLVITRLAVSAQLRNLNDPKPNNPLGRVLLAFKGDGSRIENPELAELRISEAVLREVPKLERFQSFLRLAVAAGPLLGLIGTVIGMIITFKAITASGSSDPKLMAHGIGQAMIATVLGLGIAIPLLFINSGLAALSRGVTQILDEQSHALLAATVAEAEKKHA